MTCAPSNEALPSITCACGCPRSTIELAHAVGLRIVAEGVEDADTLFELKAMGADEVQGFYLSPAVPPSEIVAMLMHAFRREPAERA